MNESRIPKISKPTVQDVYSRERLSLLLDNALERQVTWISAPGGSGKTTAVTSYLNERDIPCVWYQADEGDADPANLFYYLRKAAGRDAPDRLKPLPLLTPEYLSSLSTFARRYFEDLCNGLEYPSVIVLDNYQDVPPDAMFHEILVYGLSGVHEGIRIIAISRQGPPPEFARLRANSMMSLIGWDSLRFDIEETRGLLCEKNRVCTGEEAARLHEVTDGWVAGIVLLSENADGGQLSHFEGDIGSSGVFDYFAMEVFRRVGDRTRDFLVKTSFLPQVEPSIADALTGIDDSHKILARLNKDNFFTTKYRQDGNVYQYHPLFKEFLQARAVEVLGVGETGEVKIRAAGLLRDAGMVEEAATLFANIGDWHELSNIIRTHAGGYLAHGRSETVRGWIDSMPEDVVESEPYLLFWKGAVYSSSNPLEALKDYEKAFRVFLDQGDRSGMFMAWSGYADMCLLSMEYGHVETWVRALEDILSKDDSYPSPELEARVAMSMFNVISLQLPGHPDMDMWKDKAFDVMLMRHDVDINLKLMTGINMMVYSVWRGDFGRARSVVDFFGRFPEEDISPLVLITIKAAESLYYYIVASHEKCLGKMEETLKLGEDTGVNVWHGHVLCHGMGSALSQGDIESFDRLNKRMPKTGDMPRRADHAYYLIMTSWKALLDRDLDTAQEHVEVALNIINDAGYAPGVIMLEIGLSEVLHENGKDDEAEEHLFRAEILADDMNSGLFLYHCYLIRSRMAYGRGDVDEGLDALRIAMGHASAGGGYLNMYWWRKDVMTEHCLRALEAGIETEYVRRLVRKRGLIPDVPPMHVEDWPWPVRIYTFGRFEIYIEDEAVQSSKKSQLKPLQMLKVIISHADGVGEGPLSDLLWPDADGDAAHISFKTTLSRLRQLLGVEGAIVFKDGVVSLDQTKVWVDAYAFELLCRNALAAIDDGQPQVGRELEKAAGMYKGPFLPHDAQQPWTVAAREKFRDRFLKLIVGAGKHFERAGDYERAAEYYRMGLEVDGLYEHLYQSLMLCLNTMGRRTEAVALYGKLKENLQVCLGITPSEKTETIYKSITSA